VPNTTPSTRVSFRTAVPLYGEAPSLTTLPAEPVSSGGASGAPEANRTPAAFIVSARRGIFERQDPDARAVIGRGRGGRTRTKGIAGQIVRTLTQSLAAQGRDQAVDVLLVEEFNFALGRVYVHVDESRIDIDEQYRRGMTSLGGDPFVRAREEKAEKPVLHGAPVDVEKLHGARRFHESRLRKETFN
jgi:hypothetical protein